MVTKKYGTSIVISKELLIEKLGISLDPSKVNVEVFYNQFKDELVFKFTSYDHDFNVNYQGPLQISVIPECCEYPIGKRILK